MHRALRHVLAASATSVLLVTASSLLGGCRIFEGSSDDYYYDPPPSCSTIAPQGGSLVLQVVPTVPGHYDIVVRSDMVEADCPFDFESDGTITWDRCKVRSGAAYPDTTSSPFDLNLSGTLGETPTEVEVQVFDGDARLLVDATLTPSYSGSYYGSGSCYDYPSSAGTAYEVVVIPAPSDSVDPGDPPRFDAGTRDDDAGAPDEPGPVDAGPPDAGLD